MKKITVLLLTVLLLCSCSRLQASADRADGQGLLTVHFLDVGQADCALIECMGEYMLIDGGNVEDSSMVVSYLQNQGVETLSAVVCSHAHEDHVGGLAGVLAVFPAEAVYSPTRTYDSRCFNDFLFYADQQNLAVRIPAPGCCFSLGQAEITVLGPVRSYAETNNTSLIMRIQFGNTRFLFTGDMEMEAETDLLNSGADVRTDVLKVGHHGSDTSSGYRFLYEADPQYAVISVGRNNSYGHPDEQVLSRFRDLDIPTFRTDKLGTVVAVSDGSEITFTWENQNILPDRTEPADLYYIGNVNSKKFHLPTCSGLPAAENQIRFSTYKEAVQAGFSPCSKCLP